MNDFAPHLAPRRKLNSEPSLFRRQSAFMNRSTSSPRMAPFVAVLIGLVNKPVHSLLSRSDDHSDAAVSQDEGLLPTVCQHHLTPDESFSMLLNPLRRQIVPSNFKEAGAVR